MNSSRFLRSLTVALALAAGLSFTSSLWAISTEDAAAAKPGKVLDLSGVKPLFKKTNRVAVAGYQISFVVRNKATAHAMNILGSGTAKSSLETFLGNVDYALMQEIADAAYADFVSQLQASGVELVSADSVRAAKAYQQLETTPASAAQAYKVQFQGAHYITVPAGGNPLWFNKFDGLSGGKGSSKNIKAMTELSKELNAAVLQPSIAIDFAALETSGGKFAKRASVEAQTGILVVPAASVFWGCTDGLTYAKFQDGVWAGGATGTWANAKSSNNTALVKGLAGLGVDIGPVSSKKAIVLEADPVVFKAKAIEVLKTSNGLYARAVGEVRK